MVQRWNRGVSWKYRVYTGQVLLERSDWAQTSPDAITFRNRSCKVLTFDVESIWKKCAIVEKVTDRAALFITAKT